MVSPTSISAAAAATSFSDKSPKATWQDVTASATKSAGESKNTVDGAFFDADHDGDLDLFLVNADGPNELLINNLNGTFRPIAKNRTPRR